MFVPTGCFVVQVAVTQSLRQAVVHKTDIAIVWGALSTACYACAWSHLWRHYS